MVKVVITVDSSKVQGIMNKIPEVKKRGLQLTSQGLINELMKNSPVDHGLLKQWFVSQSSEEEIHIQSPASYAKFVNDGTGIYGPYKTPIIHPVIGKKFAFQVGGKMVYTNMIKGQKGQHFVEKSIEATQSRLTDFFMIAIREVLG